MTTIGPALTALMSWVGSLPTAEVWAGHYEPVEEWPARPRPDSHQDANRAAPGADTAPLSSDSPEAADADVEVCQ